MSGVTKFRALPMRVRRSSKLCGSDGTYTLSFTKPHKKKSHELPVWRRTILLKDKPCDFLVGFVKDKVYVPSLPRNLEDLRTHTQVMNALNLVTPDMLKRVWEEMDYRLEVVRVIRGSHIGHL
ncbi:hypothetical protein AVEN_44819-1 [Araneus ventricosus]|uniref:Uncharacterized protein n=1 Tax=Araneus ventricosus TaxID=182803 RepID=A0A4Y2CLS0_ARAVE|nr:hypothetical protein AVEN_44819-1 [Araneus ventricosus]